MPPTWAHARRWAGVPPTVARLLIGLSLLGAASPVWAQVLPGTGSAAATLALTGTISDANGQPLELAIVGIEGEPGGVSTNTGGAFRLKVQMPAPGQVLVLVVHRLGYLTQRLPLALPGDAGRPLRLTMRVDQRALGGVTVRARTDEANTREQVSITRLDPRTAKVLPSAFGDFNAILKTLPGVSGNNELSSTYNVRGGNYDENLVYVNGFEIYRPFLVTSAQQEGLSFINPDLVRSVEFSSGGWQPKYGDKLASVLSIEYKTPEKFAASLTGSLVGGAAHAEARSRNGRVSYLTGVRYKNAQYVLNSLKQTQGGYNPTFYDAQAFVNIGLGRKDDMQRTSLGLLAVVAHNDYRFSPESGEATFSTATNQFTRVFIGYDGQERMQYDTYQTGLNLRHNLTPNLQLELLGSALVSRELEYRDVEAAYTFAEINRDPNSPDFNQAVRQRDIGSQFRHSRNHLTAQVFSSETRGRWTPGTAHTVRWGLKAGRERIDDTLDEYSFADSADFVPDARRTRLRSDLSLMSTRSQGYVQDTWAIDSLRTLTYGLRGNHWSINNQLVLSPRVQFSQLSRSHANRSFKAAVGVYYQPPFYRELRSQAGLPNDPNNQTALLNLELRAQKSYHLIVGKEYSFQKFNRPFKLTAEAYVKYLTEVVPYDVDNVRLRYFAKNNATAYAAGFDTRLSGEFVKGAESWFSLGLLTTQENVEGDSINVADEDGKITGREPKGYIRRPQDQRLNVGIFFQDHLPNNPSVRGYVNLVFGSGLPFSPPNLPDLRGTNSLVSSYKRVDLGFSKVLTVRGGTKAHIYNLESLWMSLEILNVLAANNVAGYSYLQDVNGRTYAVPSYLSQRVVNLRVVARF